MPKFTVTVKQVDVRRFRKTFEAEDDLAARAVAEEESPDDEGWVELLDSGDTPSSHIEDVVEDEWEEVS